MPSITATPYRAREKDDESPADDPRAAYRVRRGEARCRRSIRRLKIPLEKLDWMQGLFVRTGNIKEPIDVKSLVAPAPREAALKLVGK